VIERREYEQRVRDAAWEIVSAEYEAYERVALSPHDQRFVGMRPFWAGLIFQGASVEGSYPDSELVIRFTEPAREGIEYGFREGIWKVVQWWQDYGPPADMLTDPERLANEMIFVMVFAIGAAPEAFADPSREEINWFTGGEAWTEVVTGGEHIPLMR
jgi:hypothetical protein